MADDTISYWDRESRSLRALLKFIQILFLNYLLLGFFIYILKFYLLYLLFIYIFKILSFLIYIDWYLSF